jgi:DNA-binding transcriptional LysR family regulator
MAVCRARGYEPHVTCQYDRAEAVLLSVGAGLGISIIPEALSRVFYSDNVAFLPIEGKDTYRNYVIAWHKNIKNPAVSLFTDIAISIFGEKN